MDFSLSTHLFKVF